MINESIRNSKYEYNIINKTCLGHILKFIDDNNSYREGEVISLSPQKVVLNCNNKTYSVKWMNILENLNI